MYVIDRKVIRAGLVLFATASRSLTSRMTTTAVVVPRL